MRPRGPAQARSRSLPIKGLRPIHLRGFTRAVASATSGSSGQ